MTQAQAIFGEVECDTGQLEVAPRWIDKASRTKDVDYIRGIVPKVERALHGGIITHLEKKYGLKAGFEVTVEEAPQIPLGKEIVVTYHVQSSDGRD